MMSSPASAALLDDDVPEFGEEVTGASRLKHPVVSAFHLAFRVGALLIYLLCERLSFSFITSFVLITLLLSADFWTVKNITGRLMVGLRWWNYVDDEGQSHWVYEARRQGQLSRVHATERQLFWAALVSAPLIWLVLLFFSFAGFRYAYMILPVMGLALTGANLYGYLRCRYGSQQDIQSSVTSFTSHLVRQHLVDNITALFRRKPASEGAGSNVQQTI